MKYENKAILVTGGAAGIGRAVVAAFLREGGKVAFTDVSFEEGERTAAEVGELGEVLFLPSDATDESDVAATVAGVVERWDRLDVAVNNAGNHGRADKWDRNLHESTLEAWQSTVAVSLTSKFLFMKHEIIQMLAQGGGVIANTASMGGLRVTSDSSPA